MVETIVLSLGGSIIIPKEIDRDFLQRFKAAIDSYMVKYPNVRLIITTGGGALARYYQNSYREIVSEVVPEAQDYLGIAATRVNAELVKALFPIYCSDPVVINPTATFSFSNRILVAAGWKPGFSTDTDAVLLAQRFGAKTLINLSNIKKVYSADPKLDPTATPLDAISWEDFRFMVGDTWKPGQNVPFDPIASQHAQAMHLKVICADGRDIGNTLAILEGRAFEGTIIG